MMFGGGKLSGSRVLLCSSRTARKSIVCATVRMVEALRFFGFS